VLVCIVSAAFRGQIVIQLPARYSQPLRPRPWHRAGRDPPLAIQLTLRLPQPPLPALHPRDDPLSIKLASRLGLGRLLGGRVVLALSLPLGGELAREPLPPTNLGTQLRRELITTLLAVLLVLGLVRRDRLSDDLLSDLVIVNVLFPDIFVPSTAITPDCTSPAFSHSDNTPLNSSAIAAS
jgi:hypothetical protein